MPGKDHRAASRQARLRDSKRRRVGSPSSHLMDVQVDGSTPITPAVDDEGEAEIKSIRPATRQRASALGSGKVAPVRRTTRRAGGYAAPPATQFVAGELRQIAMITTLIVAILVACTFVLG